MRLAEIFVYINCIDKKRKTTKIYMAPINVLIIDGLLILPNFYDNGNQMKFEIVNEGKTLDEINMALK